MTKLVVEVVDASDLMPKDGQGSANPFVEVQVDEEKQRTETKPKDLNPNWNHHKLVFNIASLRDLPSKSINVVVYNEQKGGHHRNFLGRVKIYGGSVPLSEADASVQRYPLDKRGLFSHIKGDLALKMYLLDVHDDTSSNNHEEKQSNEETRFEEIFEDNHHHGHGGEYHNHDYDHDHDHEKNNNKKKEKEKEKKKEVRVFHSVGKSKTADHVPQTPVKEKVTEFKADFMKAGQPNIMQMQVQRPNPESSLVETNIPLAARLRYKVGDKTSTTYDLVEQMHYLYVSVEKARDLPVMDVTGSLDPYVEVKLGNYKGRTKHLEKNQNPIWHQVFAFSKERLQANLIEVIVKDKDFGKDDFVGRVGFDISEVPLRVPPDSPLAPQWYRLEDKSGIKTRGEIMLAVWMGTQADEAFPDAWHSDAHDISQSNLANTRSKVYFSPKLYYLRVHVMEAQDVVPSEKGRIPDTYVKIMLGNQARVTRPIRGLNPIWNDEMLFVASEPFEDFIVVSVDDRVGPGKDETIGKVILSVRDLPQRIETTKLPDPRWLNLHKPSMAEEEGIEKRKEKFSSKILIRFVLEAGYHVLDESTHFSSDLQPSSKHLRKGNIGILELGILSAKNLQPMKGRDGRMTDAYCVAKYGNKWVRTRTILDTLHPRWNEQYTWDVYDPCTVISLGVFDNHHINGSKEDTRDQRIGKVRIRLSTLETERVYTHYYPLLVLTPSGLKTQGELHLAVKFTCMAWANMVVQYAKPLLPKMHYVQPIPFRFNESLRHQAMQIVSARLTRAEPPLRREVVEYMLDVDMNMFSLRKSKANFFRIMSLLSGMTAVCRWFNDICLWRNPVTTILVHILFFILVCYPELILPTIFLYLFVIGIWNYRFRPRHPPHMDARLSQADRTHPDELDEEFDTFPTSRPSDMVRMRYDRIRSVAGRVQTVVGDLASQGERSQALLSWRDPRATAIFIIFSLIWAVFIYVTPFQVVAVLGGIYLLRHPRLRIKTPSVPVNFFKRLPARSDMLL